MKRFLNSLKLNFPVRFKNPYFWVTLVAAILASMGVSAEMFTSWDLVWSAIVGLLQNPFQLGCAIIAVVGVLNDPTTHGIGDSTQALSYQTPKKEQ